ncbi:MAG: hypothetical protein LBQ28_03750 [Prevotellaceae bacterium]|jgi:tetratricopeptide (TPR) repeat protein|nr:hypothetical protein [Prevotellaceae bacterium]
MKNFATIDFATANYQRSSICSEGVVIVRDGKITDSLYRLVHPHPNVKNFAFEYHAQSQPEQVIACFRKIVKKNPQYARTYVKMGYTYADMGNEIKASECFRQAAQLGSLRAQAWLAGDEISKSRKAKLATFFKKHTWEEVRRCIVDANPHREKDVIWYEPIFEELKNLTPVEDDATICITDTGHVWCYDNYNHPQTPEEYYGCGYGLDIFGDKWELDLGKDVAGETIEDYSDEEIISACVGAMGFFVRG